MFAVVEGARVEPGAIDGTSHTIALLGRQQTAAFEVVLPLLERVYIAPFLGDAPVLDNLLEKREREWDGANDVCRLAGIVSEELVEVLQRPELRFCCVLEYGEFLG